LLAIITNIARLKSKELVFKYLNAMKPEGKLAALTLPTNNAYKV
jgi:hypothetical protein